MTAEHVLWLSGRFAFWALLLLAACGAGDLLLRRLRFDGRVERLALTLTAGLGLWGWALMVLGLAHGLRPLLLWLLTLAAAAVALLALGRWRRAEAHGTGAAKRWPVWLLAAVGVPYALTCAWLCLYPPMLWDSTAYHLPLAREYLARHALVVHDGVVYPLLPPLQHLLFSWAMAVDGDLLAQLVSCTFLFAVALGLFAWGRRAGRDALGLVAAALWLGHPDVLQIGAVAYVDLGVAALGFFGVYALRLFHEERKESWWILGMFLFGLAAAVKLQGLFFVAGAGVFAAHSWWRRRLTPAALGRGLGAILAAAAPAYGFIWYHSGNPFWPGSVLGTSGVWRAAADQVWSAFGGLGVAKTPLNFVLLPLQLARDARPFVTDSVTRSLPIVALLPLCWLLAARDRSIRWWTLWATAFLAGWFLTTQQLRYLLPALPLIGVAVCEGIDHVAARLRAPRPLRGVVWALVAGWALWAGAGALGRQLRFFGPLPPTNSQRESFLLSMGYSGFSGIEHLNRQAREGETAYLVNATWLTYYAMRTRKRI